MAAAKTVDQEMDESLALAAQYLPLVVSGLTRCRELGTRPLSHTEDGIKAVGQSLFLFARGLTAEICKVDDGETVRHALAVRPPNEPEKPAPWTPDIPPRGVETPPPGTVFNKAKNGFRDGWWRLLSKVEDPIPCKWPFVRWVGRYEDGERVGYWEETTEDGNLMYGVYVDGKKDGEWTQHCSNGSIQVVTYKKGSWNALRTVLVGE